MEFKGNARWNALVQVLSGFVHYANLAADIVPPKYKLWITLSVLAVQFISFAIAQFTNPDGTSAKLPWEKK